MSYSTAQIVASIFKQFVGQRLTPEFIRDESGFLCDALKVPHIGDADRKARDFAMHECLQKDDPLHAQFYWYDPNQDFENQLGRFENLYNHPDFDGNIYRVVRHMDELRKRMIEDPQQATAIMTMLSLR